MCSGTYAKVKVAYCRKTGTKYAVKIADKSNLAPKSREMMNLDKEVEILDTIDHVRHSQSI